ncbi:MAG: FAD-dependent oxidoreductase [Candidatus Magasanikbacteria bacterium]|nr:FAD-dependent oxidoreductase [Candidatus Magasanikbacteria bacterium]
MIDLVIIGGSAASCSAAIYATRRQLNFRMITQNIGGEVALSGVVNNWPGIIDIQGFELADQFAKHVRSYGVKIEEGWYVENIVPTKNYQVVVAKNPAGKVEKLQTKAVIIGTGIHPKKLSVPSEERLDHKGVTSCTVCDGPLYKGKVTVTVGSGNSALESALMLAEIAKPAYIISKFPDTPETQGGFPKGEKILIDKLKAHKNIKIIYAAKTLEITGDKKVEGIKYQDAIGVHTLAVDGVMVHVGAIPNSGFAGPVAKNKQGEIFVDTKCHTTVPGIFAAGDVTDIPHKQIVIAAGQGVIAALEAIGYINTWMP